MYWLIIVLLVVPAVEIALFIWSGSIIGPWYIMLLILLTAIIGAFLFKKAGLVTWNRTRLLLSNNEIPREELLDGICIIIGGIFLFTPGFVTDLFGFLLVIPYTRTPFKKVILYFILKRIAKGNVVYRKW